MIGSRHPWMTFALDPMPTRGVDRGAGLPAVARR